MESQTTTEIENSSPSPTKERRRASKRNSSKRHSAKSKQSKTLSLTTDLPSLPAFPSTPSSPTTMSIDSPPSGERLFLSSGGILKRSASDKSPSSGSREKLVYTHYRDGLLNENKLPFDAVTSCFMCDSGSGGGDDVRQCAHSTGTIRLHNLIESRQKTGYKIGKDGHVYVYRTVFLCVYCMEEVKKKRLLDPNFYLEITANAKTYFTGVK